MADIILGNLKFYWAGDWQGTFAYEKDDVVKYGPNAYVCITAHTSQATFAPDSAKWELMVAGIENAGTWSALTLYKFGQTVAYGGNVYIALQESTNQNPFTQTAYWQKIVDGQQWEGDYNPSSSYQKGDIVSYGGYLYVAKGNTSLNAPTNTTYWDVYVKGYQDQGPWDIQIQYRPGHIASYGGNKYVVKEGRTPVGIRPTNILDWEILVQGFAIKGNWQSGTEYRPNDIVKHGGQHYICTAETNSNAPDVNANFNLFLEGFKWRGGYTNATEYYPGDVVRYGGHLYICTEGFDNDGSSIVAPPNSDFWDLYSEGFNWTGTYSISTTYQKGDLVEYAQSSYISIAEDNVGNTPGSSPAYWELIAQGDTNAVHTTRGDIAFRDSTAVTRLPIGPAGSFLYSLKCWQQQNHIIHLRIWPLHFPIGRAHALHATRSHSFQIVN